ncbi:hypothetical protein PAEPH01_1602 [Pancytospora epiphaga]|nr:hypothetical protein PAEPH01_1602 [Pancytospora epiphaga]
MEQTELSAADIFLLTLGKLGKRKDVAYEQVITLVQKSRENVGFFAILKSIEFWICIGLIVYSLALLFVGIKRKRLMLSLLLSAALFSCLSPMENSIFYSFEKTLGRIFRNDKLGITRFVLSDRRVPVAILSLVIAMFLISSLSFLRYIILGMVLFEIYHALDGVLVGNSAYHFWGVFALSLIFVVLIGKVFNILFNTILALVFASNGSYLFLTICFVITGYPKDFVNFDIYALDSGRWNSHEFKFNFVIWLILFLLGFRRQFSVKAEL